MGCYEVSIDIGIIFENLNATVGFDSAHLNIVVNQYLKMYDGFDCQSISFSVVFPRFRTKRLNEIKISVCIIVLPIVIINGWINKK
jgi:hypothetical protein